MFKEFKDKEEIIDLEVLESFKKKKKLVKEDKQTFELIFERFYDKLNEYRESQRLLEDEKKGGEVQKVKALKPYSGGNMAEQMSEHIFFIILTYSEHNTASKISGTNKYWHELFTTHKNSLFKHLSKHIFDNQLYLTTEAYSKSFRNWK